MTLPEPHYTGSMLAAIARGVNADQSCDFAIDQRQANGTYGVHQARVMLAGDPRPYRLVLAPADAPIAIAHAGARGGPLASDVVMMDDHFSEPLTPQADDQPRLFGDR